MSNTKMLIDATHPEETRVVVQRNGRVEEFDFESAARKLLRGNIYLAKVTRVEPSLQAAFVDYGGNRHGFLAFNEIHPDYYQIPVADRQALLEEEAAAEAELEAAADRRAEALARRSAGRVHTSAPSPESADDFGEPPALDASLATSHIVDVEEDEHIEEVGGQEDGDETVKVRAASVRRSARDVRSEPAPVEEEADETSDESLPEASSADEETAGASASVEEDVSGASRADAVEPSEEQAASASESDEEHTETEDPEDQDNSSDAHPETFDDGDAPAARGGSTAREFQEEPPVRQRRRPRSYKIQEVIKRRQIILVQVVKEERGNKGAALTTYLSLAGRYTVLMPNTARGGGISRKITNPQDRRRLKSIAQELEVPEGMGLIIRTAGAARTKQEIKRDFEYLLRLWESVRELTLQSTAPSLVYEEGDLIKRSIRDLYNKDVEEILVAGEAGHQEAADFMKMLMPSHAKNVVCYKEPTPLFTRYGVERQLNAMFQPQVTLRSGGYIVINQTEALVAIDVNSGKSTREFSIEETALATNLEAADEIARQLKLRDLAGLIVIDFIDMEEKRNNRSVERRLKDALRFDRARIQLGRISHFGLMEMSRQRLRTGVLEGSTSQCPHCQGTGIIRSTESIALAVLRGLEDAITAGASGPLIATTMPLVALYILNSKRSYIADMEARHGHAITVLGSERVQGANFTIERGAVSAQPMRRVERAAVNMDWGFEGEAEGASFEGAGPEVIPETDEAEDEGARDGMHSETDDGARRGGRRRRRRGRGSRDRDEGRERFGSEARGERPGSSFRAAEDASNESDVADEGGPEDNGLGDQPMIDDAAFSDRGENGRGGDGDKQSGRRRRRGRRGGRRGRDLNQESGESSSDRLEASGQEGESEGGAEGADAAPARSASSRGRRSEVRARDNGQDAPEADGGARRPPRVWDVPPAANGVDDNTPVAAASETKLDSPASDAKVSATGSTRRRHETGSSEPRIERVVVRPGEESNGNMADAQAAPQRKGWWQRKFGGE